MLLTMTAHETAEAEEGRSYAQMTMRMGKRLGKEETSSAVDIVVVVIVGGIGGVVNGWLLDRLGVDGCDAALVVGAAGDAEAACGGWDDADVAVVGNGEGMACDIVGLSSADGRAECILDGGRLGIAELTPVLMAPCLSALLEPRKSSCPDAAFRSPLKNHLRVQKYLTRP